MIDHFREKVEASLDGKAKAMIVTRSCLHALTNPLVDLYRQMDENDRKNYKSQMRDYVKLYGFLSRSNSSAAKLR